MEKRNFVKFFSIEDLKNIGEDVQPSEKENENKEMDAEAIAREIEHEKLMLSEKRLYLLINVMNSGVIVGEGLTKDIKFVVSDEINRSIIEAKIMDILKTV